jgi:DNA N-6-adenine-methyltransferase (Dam)
MSIGGHHNPVAKSETWLTPPYILRELGPFDMDPCAAEEQPTWAAPRYYTQRVDGLSQPWEGRVWLNPPYGAKVAYWLRRLAEHQHGTALIFARTETKMFFESVWPKASSMLFIKGRLHFYFPNGQRAAANLQC